MKIRGSHTHNRDGTQFVLYYNLLLPYIYISVACVPRFCSTFEDMRSRLVYIPRVLSADTVIIIVMYSKVYSVVLGKCIL